MCNICPDSCRAEYHAASAAIRAYIRDRLRLVLSPAAAPERKTQRDAPPPKPLCSCGAPSARRGLCMRCYKTNHTRMRRARLKAQGAAL